MRLRYSLVTVFVAAILGGILALNSGESVPPAISRTTLPPSTAQSVREESPAVEIEDAGPVSAARATVVFELTASQDSPSIDGPSLLQEHCGQCHLVQLFERSNRARADWEKTLSRMEEIGVQLSQAERSVLLDLLAVPNES